MCQTCGKSSCGGCTSIPGKEVASNPCAPNWTGNIYADFDFTCEVDETLNTVKKDQLNKTLKTILTRLCQQATPELYASQEIQEDFSESWAPVTGVILTIETAGDYTIDGILNYQHGVDGNVLVWCQGEVTFMKNGTAITSVPGLKKNLEGEATASQQTKNPKRVASLMHYFEDLAVGDEIGIAIRSTNEARLFTSIGGQIRARRVIAWEDQTSD